MKYTITKFNYDWYNFEELPQEHSYFQIHNMRCETDRKAINRARKILGNKKAIIKIKEDK